MATATNQFVKGSKASSLDPNFYNIEYCKSLIFRYLRYYNRNAMNGCLELSILPYNLGYDEHPAYMIDEMELMSTCLNNSILEHKPKKK